MRSLKHQSPHRARRRAGSKNHARRLDPVSQASCVVSSRRHCSKRQHQTQIELQNLNRHYDSNQQYSITAVSDGGGSVVERYAYSAYGQITIADPSGSSISISAIANRYTYTGREWDEGLSLYHYRARMYDAVGGRFVSRDPIGFEGSPWLVYEYVYGMPLVKVDPSGLAGDCHDNFKVCIKAAEDQAKKCRQSKPDSECFDEMQDAHNRCKWGLRRCIMKRIIPRFKCLFMILVPIHELGPDPDGIYRT